MIKSLIDLQRNSKATCVITRDSVKLIPSVSIKADISDRFFVNVSKTKMAQVLNEYSRQSEVCYLLIDGIDQLSISEQNRYLGLVKDRESDGYTLPSNCVIVFTIKNKTLLKKVSPELYQFAVILM